MLIFISSGVRSGKSHLAESLVHSLADARKVYIATAPKLDAEMAERIDHHQQLRGAAFLTLEQETDLRQLLPRLQATDTVLLECLATWLTNEMITAGESQPQLFSPEPLLATVLALQQHSAHLILVSNEIFSDGIQYNDFCEHYLRYLAYLHRQIAAQADIVYECLHGRHLCYKGGELLA